MSRGLLSDQRDQRQRIATDASASVAKANISRIDAQGVAFAPSAVRVDDARMTRRTTGWRCILMLGTMGLGLPAAGQQTAAELGSVAEHLDAAEQVLQQGMRQGDDAMGLEWAAATLTLLNKAAERPAEAALASQATNQLAAVSDPQFAVVHRLTSSAVMNGSEQAAEQAEDLDDSWLTAESLAGIIWAAAMVEPEAYPALVERARAAAAEDDWAIAQMKEPGIPETVNYAWVDLLEAHLEADDLDGLLQTYEQASGPLIPATYCGEVVARLLIAEQRTRAEHTLQDALGSLAESRRQYGGPADRADWAWELATAEAGVAAAELLLGQVDEGTQRLSRISLSEPVVVDGVAWQLVLGAESASRIEGTDVEHFEQAMREVVDRAGPDVRYAAADNMAALAVVLDDPQWLAEAHELAEADLEERLWLRLTLAEFLMRREAMADR